MLSNQDLLKYCEDLHSVKGSVSQLQLAINVIVTTAPSPDTIKQIEESVKDQSFSSSNNNLVERTRNLLYSPQTRVAVQLNKLYNENRLPLLTLINKANLKSQVSDKYVGYIVDYTPSKPDLETLSLIVKPGQNQLLSNADSITSYPPSLPPLDPQLLQLASTDKSYRRPSDFILLMNYKSYSLQHNAKLAIRGKKLLESILLEILDEKFPLLHEDDLVALSHKLTHPNILIKFTIGYHLIDELKSLTSKEGLSIEEKSLILSKAFLAYVGAMSMRKDNINNYTFDEIKVWILALYKPIIQEWYDVFNNNDKLFKFELIAKSELKSLLEFAEENDIKYELRETDPVFIVDVKYKDQVLGTGTNLKLEEDAAMRAAVDALTDKSKLTDLLLAHQEEGEKVKPFSMTSKKEDIKSIGTIVNLEGENETSGENTVESTISKKSLSIILKTFNLVPIYKYKKIGKDYVATVLVDDVTLGQAMHNTKKIAAQNAAVVALLNKELTQFLASKASIGGDHIENNTILSPQPVKVDSNIPQESHPIQQLLQQNLEQQLQLQQQPQQHQPQQHQPQQHQLYQPHPYQAYQQPQQQFQQQSYQPQTFQQSHMPSLQPSYQQSFHQQQHNQFGIQAPNFGNNQGGHPNSLPNLPPVPLKNKVASPKMKNPPTLPNIPRMNGN